MNISKGTPLVQGLIQLGLECDKMTAGTHIRSDSVRVNDQTVDETFCFYSLGPQVVTVGKRRRAEVCVVDVE